MIEQRKERSSDISSQPFLSRHAKGIVSITIGLSGVIYLGLIAAEVCWENKDRPGCFSGLDFLAGMTLGLSFFLVPIAMLLNAASLLLLLKGRLSRRLSLVLVSTWLLYLLPPLFGALRLWVQRF